MNKKIIAILLVFTLVITCFVACQKEKLDTVKINGEDVALATDKDGNTIINDDNQVAVLVTDSEGEVITYSNGEDQTRWVGAVGGFVAEDFVMGEHYKLALIEGWSGDDSGKVIKDGTDGDCYIQFVKNKETSKNDTYAGYLETIDNQNEQLIPAFEKEGLTLTIEKNNETVGIYNSQHYIYKIVDGDGKVVHYAENYYFIAGETIYSVNYACTNGVGYDESFNFGNYVRDSFTFTE